MARANYKYSLYSKGSGLRLMLYRQYLPPLRQMARWRPEKDFMPPALIFYTLVATVVVELRDVVAYSLVSLVMAVDQQHDAGDKQAEQADDPVDRQAEFDQ